MLQLLDGGAANCHRPCPNSDNKTLHMYVLGAHRQVCSQGQRGRGSLTKGKCQRDRLLLSACPPFPFTHRAGTAARRPDLLAICPGPVGTRGHRALLQLPDLFLSWVPLFLQLLRLHHAVHNSSQISTVSRRFIRARGRPCGRADTVIRFASHPPHPLLAHAPGWILPPGL